MTATIALKGDASARRFWRVAIEHQNGVTAIHDGATPSSAIAIDLGPDDLPLYARALKLIPEPLVEPPWLNVHRFLESICAAVPEVFAIDTQTRMLLVEDVGELPLFEAALQGGAGDLYRLAADELLVFHLEGTRLLETAYKTWPRVVRVVYTGYLSSGLVVDAVNRANVHKVLAKDMAPEQLRAQLAEVVLEIRAARPA